MPGKAEEMSPAGNTSSNSDEAAELADCGAPDRRYADAMMPGRAISRFGRRM
jgi:hypothetical protein